MAWIGEVVLLVVLLFLAALTASCEIAMIAMSRLRLRERAEEGSRRAKAILSMLEVPERFFSTILVANNIMDALIAVVVTEMVIRAFRMGGGREVLVSTLVASFLIIASETTAKSVATRYPERISFALALPAQLFIRIFAPVVAVFTFIADRTIRFFGIKRTGKASLVTEEEIRAFIRIGEEEGVLQKDESRMLARVFDFGDTLVKAVMTPKDDMVAVDVSSPVDDIMVTVSECGYSRIPVYQGEAGRIVGVFNAKDLLNLACNRDLIVLQDIIYPATFVREEKRVSELLKEFQKGHTHLAVVTDREGTVRGIVTLEDLLEEIVGEIEDEYDVRAL